MPRWENKTILERFEDKYIPVTESGCWLWEASYHNRGYGLFYTGRKLRKGKMEFAHRVSYELYKGYMPSPDEEVCHSCDNPCCVNPSHLFLGTHTINMQDMVRKKRLVSGREILSKSDVEIALQMRENGLLLKDIADHFGVSDSQISRIIRGQRKHFNS